MHIRENNNNITACVTGYFQQQNNNKMTKGDYSRLNVLSEMVMRALDLLVQRCGSLLAFISHAKVHVRLV